MSWFFLFLGLLGVGYWIRELKQFDDNGEENRDFTAHPFL
jgi:hypothetical protein